MGEQSEIRKNRKKKDQKAQGVIIVLLVLFVTLVLVGLAFLIRNQQGQKPNTTPSQSDIMEGVVTSQVVEKNDYKNPEDINWNLESKVAEVDWKNAEDATSNRQYTVMDENKNVLYTSDVLKPGQTIKEVTMELPYTEAGEYAISLRIASVDATTGEVVSAVIYKKTIVVE